MAQADDLDRPRKAGDCSYWFIVPLCALESGVKTGESADGVEDMTSGWWTSSILKIKKIKKKRNLREKEKEQKWRLVIDDGALKLGFFMYPMKWNLCSNPMTKITLVKRSYVPMATRSQWRIHCFCCRIKMKGTLWCRLTKERFKYAFVFNVTAAYTEW